MGKTWMKHVSFDPMTALTACHIKCWQLMVKISGGSPIF